MSEKKTETFDLQAAKEACERATPGPWHSCDDIAPKLHLYAAPMHANGLGREVEYLGQSYCDGAGQGRANMKFIALARSALPACIAEVERLRAECEHPRRLALRGASCLEMTKSDGTTRREWAADIRVAVDSLPPPQRRDGERG